MWRSAPEGNRPVSQPATLPATRELQTLNETVSWKLGVRRIRIRMGPQSYNFRIVVLPAEFVLFCREKKAPVAAGKTSPSLIYVKKLQKHFWGREKKRLRQPRRPPQTYYTSQKIRNAFLAGPKRPRQPGRLTELITRPTITGTTSWPKKTRLRQTGRLHQA